MSTATNRLRRAGVGGVAAALAITSLAAAGTAFAAPTHKVTAGASSQAADNIEGSFVNSFTAGATLTFTINGNDCSTPAGLATAVGFSAVPTLTATPAAGSDATTTKPAFSAGSLDSVGNQCAANGVQDEVTFKTTAASAGKASDTIDYVLSKILYNVGADAAAGDTVDVTVSGLDTLTGTVSTATIVTTSYTFIPVVAAQLNSTNQALGTATFKETTAGAYFTAGKETTVVLTLSSGKFTKGVTPTVSVPAGYTVSSKPATTDPAASTYTFKVTAPATATKATVTVSGLKYDAPGAATTATITAAVTPAGGATVTTDSLDAVNVVDYTARSGGSDRYATAAAVFNSEFGGGVDHVVLSGGGLYPDALSANYLAGKLAAGQTGTLLTGATKLPAVTRQAIFNAGVSTVYITGGTGAVSEAVANEIRSMHVNNNPSSAFISVVRLGGADRYATNQVVNEYAFESANTVLLASGNGFADALALGPIAYANQYPLVLTNGKTLGASEQAQLNDFSPANIVIAGGTGVVSQSLEDSLKAKGYNVLRLGGNDRTLTAAQIATWASVGVAPKTGLSAGPDTMLNSSTVYVTNGMGFADALSAGPVAGINSSVIMPTANVTSLGGGLASYLGSKTVGATNDGAHVAVLHALGLTGAVSNGVMKDAAAAIGS